jgi:hypothetical protein
MESMPGISAHHVPTCRVTVVPVTTDHHIHHTRQQARPCQSVKLGHEEQNLAVSWRHVHSARKKYMFPSSGLLQFAGSFRTLRLIHGTCAFLVLFYSSAGCLHVQVEALRSVVVNHLTKCNVFFYFISIIRATAEIILHVQQIIPPILFYTFLSLEEEEELHQSSQMRLMKLECRPHFAIAQILPALFRKESITSVHVQSLSEAQQGSSCLVTCLVSCLGVSRLATQGLSLHGLVL